MLLVHKMLIKNFFSTFVFAITFFILILVLGNIFVNISSYIANHTSVDHILLITYYFLPQAVIFALPVSLLFAVSYTLGQLYANNELIAILTMGISLFRLVWPLLFIGLFLSIALFFFNDQVVLKQTQKKNVMMQLATGRNPSKRSEDIVIVDQKKNIIYDTPYYDVSNETFYNSFLIMMDRQHIPIKIIFSELAKWNPKEKLWVFTNANIYYASDGPHKHQGKLEKQNNVKPKEPMLLPQRAHSFQNDPYVLGSGSQILPFYHYEQKAQYSDPNFNKAPQLFATFQSSEKQLNVVQFYRWLKTREQIGLSKKKDWSDFYQRFSFPFTCFIVVFLAIGAGSRFQKNVLLLTLSTSLVIALFYYILQMIVQLTLENRFPLLAAWAPTVITSVIAYFLFRRARS